MTEIETRHAINAANAAVSQLRGRKIPSDRLAAFGASDARQHAKEIAANTPARFLVITLAARMFEIGRMAGKSEALAERVREVCER